MDGALRAFYQQDPALIQRALAALPKRTAVEGTLITKGLYQGMAPPCGPALRASGIDTIILCAEEWQPPRNVDPACAVVLGYRPGLPAYPGVNVVYAPADDDFDNPPSASVIQLASKAASIAAVRAAQGGKVLVTCWMGRNRSGLVTALALHALTGMSGSQIIQHIKRVRPVALSNPQFRAALSKIQASPAAPTV